MWSPPAETLRQSLEPMSSSTAKRRGGAVVSVQAKSDTDVAKPAAARAITPTQLVKRTMADGTGRRGIRAALVFGIGAATIEFGIVLWMMYC